MASSGTRQTPSEAVIGIAGEHHKVLVPGTEHTLQCCQPRGEEVGHELASLKWQCSMLKLDCLADPVCGALCLLLV